MTILGTINRIIDKNKSIEYIELTDVEAHEFQSIINKYACNPISWNRFSDNQYGYCYFEASQPYRNVKIRILQ